MKNIKSFDNFLNERLYDFSHPDVKDKWALRVPNELPQKFDDMKCIDNTGFENELVVGATYKNLGYSSIGDKIYVMDSNKEHNYFPLKCFWKEANESVRDQMKPKSEEEIDDAFEEVANKAADILVAKYDFDDTYDAYEWANDHKEVIMEAIDDDPEYDLDDIIYKILYGYEGAMDSH